FHMLVLYVCYSCDHVAYRQIYTLSLHDALPIYHPEYDATDPNSYDRLSRMMWNYAAYYGFETHPEDSIQTPYPELSGLGLRHYVDRKSTRLNSSHVSISYAVVCLKKKKRGIQEE